MNEALVAEPTQPEDHTVRENLQKRLVSYEAEVTKIRRLLDTPSPLLDMTHSQLSEYGIWL